MSLRELMMEAEDGPWLYRLTKLVVLAMGTGDEVVLEYRLGRDQRMESALFEGRGRVAVKWLEGEVSGRWWL